MRELSWGTAAVSTRSVLLSEEPINRKTTSLLSHLTWITTFFSYDVFLSSHPSQLCVDALWRSAGALQSSQKKKKPGSLAPPECLSNASGLKSQRLVYYSLCEATAEQWASLCQSHQSITWKSRRSEKACEDGGHETKSCSLGVSYRSRSSPLYGNTVGITMWGRDVISVINTQVLVQTPVPAHNNRDKWSARWAIWKSVRKAPQWVPNSTFPLCRI